MNSRSTSIVAAIALATGLSVPARAQLVPQNFWHMGEDTSLFPSDSVGGKGFTEKVGTPIVSALHAPNSTASLRYTRDANTQTGSYMGSPSDYVSIPATNWVFEMWVNIQSTTPGGTSLAHLGGLDGNSGWADIKLSDGGTVFFGRENESYGVFTDTPLAQNTWQHLAYAQYGGRIHGYVNGIELTSSFGADTLGASTNNSGQLHIGLRPGNSEHFDGYVDEMRLSTFAEGGFRTGDLLVNAAPVPEPATMAALGLGALALLRRRAVRKA